MPINVREPSRNIWVAVADRRLSGAETPTVDRAKTNAICREPAYPGADGSSALNDAAPTTTHRPLHPTTTPNARIILSMACASISQIRTDSKPIGRRSASDREEIDCAMIANRDPSHAD